MPLSKGGRTLRQTVSACRDETIHATSDSRSRTRAGDEERTSVSFRLEFSRHGRAESGLTVLERSDELVFIDCLIDCISHETVSFEFRVMVRAMWCRLSSLRDRTRVILAGPQTSMSGASLQAKVKAGPPKRVVRITPCGAISIPAR